MVGRVCYAKVGKQHVYKGFATIRTRLVTDPGTSNSGSGKYIIFD